MKRLAATALALGALLGIGTAPADAFVVRTDSVAPITCHPEEDSCELAFVANAGNGYWMARQNGGSTWVRLTLVPGWSTNVAPITCKYSNSCLIDFVGVTAGGGHAYWRAAQASGSVWVRLTLVNGA